MFTCQNMLDIIELFVRLYRLKQKPKKKVCIAAR